MKVKITKYPTNRWYNGVLYRWFGYSPDQKVKVHIDKFDTWAMDSTLSHIILPMLKQLKETKNGSCIVDKCDVPKEITDIHDRWDWVLNEMIWSFEQKKSGDWQLQYYGDFVEGKEGGILGGTFEWVDYEGLKAHQERMSNGFKLFGKYYEGLWD